MTSHSNNAGDERAPAGPMILLGCSYPPLAHLAALSGRPGLIAASIGWLVVFLPWVLRSLWIYATPRIDGRAG